MPGLCYLDLQCGCTLHLLPLQISAGWPGLFCTFLSFMFVSYLRGVFEVL